MKEGLLWYDDDPARDLAEKIGLAARRYQQKFGAPPNICYVHPSVVSASPLSSGDKARKDRAHKIGGMQVAVLPSVLQHHFWLGQEDRQRGRGTAESRTG